MKRIRIINGTYGHRPEGSARLDPKNATSPPFEVGDAEAERLVRLKVAAYAGQPDFETPGITEATTGAELPPSGVATPEGGGNGDDTDDADIPAYSAEMSLEELKDIFKDCGLTYKVGMSKADMVAWLDEHFATDDDGETPPALNTEEPVT